jgi:hypothetical protein
VTTTFKMTLTPIERANLSTTSSSTLRYRVTALSHIGPQIQISMQEDIETERVDPTEQMLESIRNNEQIPKEMREMMQSLLRPYLQQMSQYIQPQTCVGNIITISVPSRLYNQIGRPNIDDIIRLKLEKEPDSA